MRNISEKTSLAVDEAGKAVSHAVDGIAQSAELIEAVGGELDLEMAFGNLSCRTRELPDRAGEPADKWKPADNGDEGNSKQNQQPRPVVEKEVVRP